MSRNVISFHLKDCREDLMELGRFDIIHLGFAVKNISKFLNLLNDGGVAFAPIQKYPQDHDYKIFKKE